MNCLACIKKVVVLISLTWILISCGESNQIVDKKVFRYNEFSTLSSLDPAFATYLANGWAMNQLFNGPLEFNDKMEVVPGLAKSWAILDSGKHYVLTVRDDVYFHDHELFNGGKGRKCTAYDLEYSLRRICDTTDIYNKGIWIFKDKVLRNEKGLLSDTCFKASNDTTFNIYLDHASPSFLQVLCMNFCRVVPKEVAEHYERDFGRNPVGTGPFKFESWDDGNKLILTKNENYWKKDSKGQSLPYLDAVEISFITDLNQYYRAFQLGYFDMATRLEAAILDEVLYADGTVRDDVKQQFNIFKGPYLATDYLAFQLDPNSEIYEGKKDHPFLNKEVRKALSYAIDRKRIVKLLRNGFGVEGKHGMVPDAMPYFDAKEVKGYGFDPNKAIEALNKSGYKAEDLSGIKLSITKRNKELAEFLTKTWKEILGITVDLELNEGKVVIDLADNGRISFFKLSWLADYPEGENYLTLFYGGNFSPDGPNRTHFKNTRYDELYEKSLFLKDPKERGKVYEEMDGLLMEECPVIVLFYDEILAVLDKRVENFKLDPMNNLKLEQVDISLTK